MNITEFDFKNNKLPEILPILKINSAVLMPKAQLPVCISQSTYNEIEHELIKNNIIGIIQPNTEFDIFKIGCAGVINEIHNIEDEVTEETYKELNIPEQYKHILDPLPQEFKQVFIGAKESESGFAWVKKSRNSWRYDRQIKDQRQSITRPNIYELYCEVKKQGFVWGLRKHEKKKITLKQCEILDINTNDDEDIFKHILDPIAPEYNKRFRKPTSSGFAWVKKSRNSWRYNNETLGKDIQNINLYYLYLDVTEKNLPWGVRDLEKAN